MSATLTGPALREWREAHGWFRKDLAAALGAWGDKASVNWEAGRCRIPAQVVAYVAQHPAPPSSSRYPMTPEGLRAAVTQWPTYAAWCVWWGVSNASLYRWLAGAFALPLPLRAWLRAGAPTTWGAKGCAGRGGRRIPGARYAGEPISRPGLTRWHQVAGIGWVPPEGYCDPLHDVLRLRGCAQCGYRADCVAMFGKGQAS